MTWRIPFATVLLLALAVLLLALAGCLQGETGAPAPSERATGDTPSAMEGRLAAVKERGSVICASNTSNPGFGYVDSAGNIVGFDVDLCKAVAAAVFDDPDAIEVKSIDWIDRAALLQNGEVDIVSYNSTWTTSRDARWGNFPHIMFYTGQGFMVRKDSGFESPLDLDGATVCVTSSTTTELNLADYFGDNNLQLKTFTSEVRAEVYQAYEAGRCDAATDDTSGLAAGRSVFASPDEHKILPETISKEPLAPIVPANDDQWYDLVKTVMHVLINAEELGVTQSNVAAMQTSDNPAIRRMLGGAEEFGQAEMGLEPDFAVAVIKGVGNYGEIYDRYLGPNGDSFTLDRGMNNLWTHGGLIYAPPIR